MVSRSSQSGKNVIFIISFYEYKSGADIFNEVYKLEIRKEIQRGHDNEIYDDKYADEGVHFSRF